MKRISCVSFSSLLHYPGSAVTKPNTRCCCNAIWRQHTLYITASQVPQVTLYRRGDERTYWWRFTRILATSSSVCSHPWRRWCRLLNSEQNGGLFIAWTSRKMKICHSGMYMITEIRKFGMKKIHISPGISCWVLFKIVSFVEKIWTKNSRPFLWNRQ